MLCIEFEWYLTKRNWMNVCIHCQTRMKEVRDMDEWTYRWMMMLKGISCLRKYFFFLPFFLSFFLSFLPFSMVLFHSFVFSFLFSFTISFGIFFPYFFLFFSLFFLFISFFFQFKKYFKMSTLPFLIVTFPPPDQRSLTLPNNG